MSGLCTSLHGVYFQGVNELLLSGADMLTDNAFNTVKLRKAIEQVINVVILFLNFGTYMKYLIAHIRS